MKQIDFLVCVRCFTFNHAPYIKDAMDGFCMQKTSFPFVCVIVDDASTDGEPNVIRTYMGQHFNIDDKNVVRNVETDDYVMTFAQHKVNENCFFAVYYLKYNHYSIKKDKFPYFIEYHDNAKYIALCEGDDYWVNPNKLQIQVNYLNTNSDCGLVYGYVRIYNQDNKRMGKIWGGPTEKFDDLIIESTIPTLTVLIRTSLYLDYIKNIKPENKCWLMGDYPIWLYVSQNSSIKFLSVLMGTYRLLSESASHSKSFENSERFVRNLFDMKRFFISLYGYQININDYLYMSLARNAFFHKKRINTRDYISRMQKKNMKYKIMLFLTSTRLLFNLTFQTYKIIKK